jgi:hypothetical protein
MFKPVNPRLNLAQNLGKHILQRRRFIAFAHNLYSFLTDAACQLTNVLINTYRIPPFVPPGDLFLRSSCIVTLPI